MDQAYRSALEGTATAQPRTLHTAAGPCGIGRERRALHRHAGRRARRQWPSGTISQRRLGPTLAGWPRNAVLHAFSRSPSSWAGMYARASTRIPVERGGGRDLELGKAVERVRVVRISAEQNVTVRPTPVVKYFGWRCYSWPESNTL